MGDRRKHHKTAPNDRAEGLSSAKRIDKTLLLPTIIIQKQKKRKLLYRETNRLFTNILACEERTKVLTLFNSSNKGRDISTLFLGIIFMATLEFCDAFIRVIDKNNRFLHTFSFTIRS